MTESSDLRLLLRPYWAALGLGGLWCLLQVLGGPDLWGYARQAIEDGQLWRLLTAQFVHLNSMHLLLNLLGLAGIMTVWGEALARPVILLGVFVGSAWAVSLGLWLLAPEIAWYAGASGALHGLFAAGILLATRASLGLRTAAALGLILKLVLEARLNTGSAALIGAPIIHAAHQFGAFGGVLSALVWRLLRRASQAAGPVGRG